MKENEAGDGRGLSALSLVQEHSLASALKLELERMIFDGSIGAGQRLNESILVARFGTSRGPLREALQALGEQGLVSFTRSHGAFVRQLTIDEAQELYDLRAALDDEVGRKLASHRLSLGLERPALVQDRIFEQRGAAQSSGWDTQGCAYARQSASCSSASPKSTGCAIAALS